MKSYQENPQQFAQRKQEHIDWSLRDESQARGMSDFHRVRLLSDSLPDLDFSAIVLETKDLRGQLGSSPFYVAAMTAGHKEAGGINYRLAQACEQKSWDMMVGSQRRQLFDEQAREEWAQIRHDFPQVRLIGNIGLSQIAELSDEQLLHLVESLGGYALAIHCNPLQEAIQAEGTRNFSFCMARLKDIAASFPYPVLVKETGSGLSAVSLRKLAPLKLAAVDVSGLGGTHWGRIEGLRAPVDSLSSRAARTYADFGVPTLESLRYAREIMPNTAIWASGGVRSGLDAAKCLAMGAQRVGTAAGVLAAAMRDTAAVLEVMEAFEYELKIALFCTESKNLELLQGKYEWVEK